MEKRYYTYTPEGEWLLWLPSTRPSLAWSPETITGDIWRLQQEFEQYSLIFVPWEIVLAVSQ